MTTGAAVTSSRKKVCKLPNANRRCFFVPGTCLTLFVPAPGRRYRTAGPAYSRGEHYSQPNVFRAEAAKLNRAFNAD